MVIREEQVDALRKNRKDEFAVRVSRFVRSHLSAQTEAYSDPELLIEVEKQIESGRSAGLTSEVDLVSFVGFRFMAGADFRSQPPFAAIWERSDLDGHAKVARTRDLMQVVRAEKRV